MSRILLVLDGVAGRERAARWALGAAERAVPSTLVAVVACAAESVMAVPPQEPFFAWNPYTVRHPLDQPTWTRDREQRQDAHRHVVHGSIDRTLRSLHLPAGVTLETHVFDEPHAQDELTRMAEQSDLVVVDADPHAGGCLDPERLAHHLLRRTTTPIVLVP